MTPIWVESEVSASADAGVTTNDEGHPQRIKFSVVRGFRKREIVRRAGQHLATGTHAVSDGLKCFDAVREAGCAHEAVVLISIQN